MGDNSHLSGPMRGAELGGGRRMGLGVGIAGGIVNADEAECE